jgi:hypothetical protein
MIIIPDVHGRTFWRQTVQEYLGKEHILFLGDVSYSRWGNRPYGSPVWNDVDDLAKDQEEVPGFIQVFGHTQQVAKPVICDYYMCLDVRCAFKLSDINHIQTLT